jgi:hypothetical protein
MQGGLHLKIMREALLKVGDLIGLIWVMCFRQTLTWLGERNEKYGCLSVTLKLHLDSSGSRECLRGLHHQL